MKIIKGFFFNFVKPKYAFKKKPTKFLKGLPDGKLMIRILDSAFIEIEPKIVGETKQNIKDHLAGFKRA